MGSQLSHTFITLQGHESKEKSLIVILYLTSYILFIIIYAHDEQAKLTASNAARMGSRGLMTLNPAQNASVTMAEDPKTQSANSITGNAGTA